MSTHAQHGAQASSGHATVSSYLVGFVLSAILTIIPFWLVMTGVLPKGTTVLIIALMAAAQVIVQLYFFLHMDSSPSQRWSLMSFVFTAIILAIILVGSLWVIHNMHANMLH
jgi:cytochrome o ubiquinol oxidase operon protein cyoD